MNRPPILKTWRKYSRTASSAENSLTAVVNDLDSLSDSIKNAADNKAKVQVIRDIVAKIPGTGTDSHREANEDNKFADIATDPINSFENE